MRYFATVYHFSHDKGATIGILFNKVKGDDIPRRYVIDEISKINNIDPSIVVLYDFLEVTKKEYNERIKK